MRQKCVKLLLCLSAVLMFTICAFETSGGISEFEAVKAPVTNAKIETWYEQNFWDVFWGTGFWQTRTRYTINPSAANTARSYENKELLLSTENKTLETQPASYNYTSRVGHNFDATITGKKSHFEAAIGYSLVYETTTSYTVNVNVPAHTMIDVWGSDVRVKSQYTTYETQVERSSTNGWINHGDPSTSRPLIKQYSGKHIEWSYN